MGRFSANISKLCFFSFVLLFLFGCSYGGVLNVRVKPASFQEKEKIRLKVVLLIDDEFRNAKFEEEPSSLRPNIYLLGENFEMNSKALANAIFTDVTVAHSESDIEGKEFDVLLKPKMISIEQSSFLWVWEVRILTVAMKWSLRDQDRNIVWVNTIVGEGATKVVKEKERIELLIDDLFTKAYAAIYSSSEINQYAKEIAQR